MNIVQFVIKRKTFVSMFFTMLVLLGYISYTKLPVELLPNAELPFLIVNVSAFREVDPDYMEKQAIIPLEGAISTLEGIDEIESFVERQRGVITVYFNQNVKIKYAYLKLQEKVDAIKSSLSDDFIVNVFKVDTDQIANLFMSLQVRGSGGLDRVRYIVDQKILNELENIEGIANVEVYGGREKSVEILLNEDACRAHSITAAQIRTLITQNSQNKTFLGQAKEKNKQYFVNLVAEYTDVNDLENIVVSKQGPILLKDIAEVRVGVKEETTISRVNGKEAVSIQLVRDTQVNLIDLSHTTQAVIERLNKELATEDIEISIQSNTAEEMETNIDLIIQLAIIGGLFAIVILYLFLRNFQMVSIIALSIPISIFTAFFFFYFNDISINSLTLVGMALAVGMLLDNSIVVLENIYRLITERKDINTAVVKGTNEVWRSIFAATLTTITVFLPFIFASDFVIKLIGRHVGVSIISTLLVSLVVALLLIPMATHFFLTKKLKNTTNVTNANFNIVSFKSRLLQIYRVFLKSTIRYPARTIIIAFVIFMASIVICLAISVNVPQEVELKDFNLYVTMAKGATLESTDQVVSELESKLEDIAEKQDIVSTIEEEEAIISIKLKDDYEKINNRTIEQIKTDIQNRIEDYRAAEVSFEQPQSSRRFQGGGGRNPGAGMERMMGMGSNTEKVVIKGKDFEVMRNIAEDIRYYLDELSTVNWVRVDLSDNRPEIHLLLDKELMSNYDITISTISSELFGFQNEFSSGLKYKQGTDEYDIIIKNENLEEKQIDDLKTLNIPSESSGIHELQELGRIIYSFGMSGFSRVNQEKQIEVSYQLLSEITDSNSLLEAARKEIDQLIANLRIPSGIAIEVIHEEADYSEYYFLIGAAFILIYMILASVFESLATPLVIMFTIPLATIGSFWGLILTENSLINANTLTGFIILLGVVVNNGIILIDYSRILRKNGYNISRALITAGQARVRPILITTITTIVAMLPLAMGQAEYVTRIGAPFAITVIGGLSLSTLFTLVFIPTVYSGLETALQWFRNLNWRLKVLQLLIFILSGSFIYYNIDSLLWRYATLFVLLLGIPAVLYFVMTSLRQAQAEYIRKDEALHINIQHVVKIYDDDSRFVREWKKGKKIRDKSGIEKDYRSWRDFDILLWQIPVLIFLIYFVYFYQKSDFWMFLLSHSVYFFVFFMWKPIQNFLVFKGEQSGKPTYQKLCKWFYNLFFWGFPFFNLVIFHFKWDKITILIFIAFIWYLALAIYTTSNRLHKEKINIMRLTGRFSGIRRSFYQFVKIIPIIGRKKNPFKALDGVTLDIGSGMFGLLGPNGAGKTTLMRIICGILEQSRGTIRINNIDLKEKREELQGLIGYLPQEFGTYENMTAYEFLNYQAILKNILDKDERENRVDYVISAVHLQENRDKKIGSFSGGMKQRIGIAQTLLHLPRILVVDEPTAGLDPRERIRFRNLLVELSRERIVIFSTHIIEDISSSCNKVAVLNRGQLRYLGDPQEMTKTAEGVVWQFYISPKEFETVAKEKMIVHHMRDKDRIRVRCISKTKPAPDAEEVRPSLEDAYLWLLRKKEN